MREQKLMIALQSPRGESTKIRRLGSYCARSQALLRALKFSLATDSHSEGLAKA